MKGEYINVSILEFRSVCELLYFSWYREILGIFMSLVIGSCMWESIRKIKY